MKQVLNCKLQLLSNIQKLIRNPNYFQTYFLILSIIL